MGQATREGSPWSVMLGALVFGMLLLGGYRCNALSSCAEACTGMAGYELTGWDRCACIEPTADTATR